MFIAWLLTKRFIVLLNFNSFFFVTIPLFFNFDHKPTTFLLANKLSDNYASQPSTLDHVNYELETRVQRNLLTDDYKSSIHSHNHLQENSLSQGEYRDDELYNDKTVNIGPKAWATIPNCQFYIQHKGVCDPFSAYAACRFCKDKSFKILGLPNCPGDDSFIASLQGKYHWALTPYRIKKKLYMYYFCFVKPGPSPTYNDDTSTNAFDSYQKSHASRTLLSFCLFSLSLLIFTCL